MNRFAPSSDFEKICSRLKNVFVLIAHMLLFFVLRWIYFLKIFPQDILRIMSHLLTVCVWLVNFDVFDIILRWIKVIWTLLETWCLAAVKEVKKWRFMFFHFMLFCFWLFHINLNFFIFLHLKVIKFVETVLSGQFFFIIIASYDLSGLCLWWDGIVWVIRAFSLRLLEKFLGLYFLCDGKNFSVEICSHSVPIVLMLWLLLGFLKAIRDIYTFDDFFLMIFDCVWGNKEKRLNFHSLWDIFFLMGTFWRSLFLIKWDILVLSLTAIDRFHRCLMLMMRMNSIKGNGSDEIEDLGDHLAQNIVGISYINS